MKPTYEELEKRVAELEEDAKNLVLDVLSAKGQAWEAMNESDRLREALEVLIAEYDAVGYERPGHLARLNRAVNTTRSLLNKGNDND